MNKNTSYNIEILPKYEHPLYEQRELGTTHSPFELEYALYTAIRNGNDTQVAQAIAAYEQHGFIIGHMSENKIHQVKYWAVSSIAIAIHYAILGGLDETDAYNLSDEYIQEIDHFSTMEQCIEYLSEKAVELASQVKSMQEKNTLSPKTRKCVHYIHVHLHEKISVTDLAYEVHLSKDYLPVLFKKEVGDSIHSYITKKRLQASIIMLADGMTYDEISYSLAFCSQSHYISCFKKEYGITPGVYKQKYLDI